jgi:acyl dehydratase
MSEQRSVAERYSALIGQEYVYTAPEAVGRASIRQFAMAIGDLNPLYLDQHEAAKGPYGDVVAPPTFICETMQYYRGQVDEEGGFTDRVRLIPGQAIRAGNDYVFHRPLRPDDVITARWRVHDIYERRGRTGHLLFLVIDITYTNQQGTLLAENRETIVYRLEAASPQKTSS